MPGDERQARVARDELAPLRTPGWYGRDSTAVEAATGTASSAAFKRPTMSSSLPSSRARLSAAARASTAGATRSFWRSSSARASSHASSRAMHATAAASSRREACAPARPPDTPTPATNREDTQWRANKSFRSPTDVDISRACLTVVRDLSRPFLGVCEGVLTCVALYLNLYVCVTRVDTESLLAQSLSAKRVSCAYSSNRFCFIELLVTLRDWG